MEEESPRFQPVVRRSLSEAVYEQLRDQILLGEIAAGEGLPSERGLSEALGVNRQAVREGLRRLEHAGLVVVQHGGTTKVLDYRRTAGMGLLPDLLIRVDGSVDPAVARSIFEMRSALAPEIARLAARRGGLGAAEELERIVVAMREAGGDLALLQRRALEFWGELVEVSGNVAYRLAFNSMEETYARFEELLRPLLAEELIDGDSYAAIAAAVAAADSSVAEDRARRLIEIGAERIFEVLGPAPGEGGQA